MQINNSFLIHYSQEQCFLSVATRQSQAAVDKIAIVSSDLFCRGQTFDAQNHQQIEVVRYTLLQALDSGN